MKLNAITLTPTEVLELVHAALHARGVQCHPSSLDWIGETRSVVVRPPPGVQGRELAAELILRMVESAPMGFWELIGRCGLDCDTAEAAIRNHPQLELVDANSDSARVRKRRQKPGKRGRS